MDENEKIYFYVKNNSDLKEAAVEVQKDTDGNVTGEVGLIVTRGARIGFSSLSGPSYFAQHPMVPILDEDSVPAEANGKLTVTPKEARQLAETVLEGTDMVVRDLYLTDDAAFGYADGITQPAETYAYRVYCVRKTQGILQSFLRENATPAGGSFAPTWNYETLEIFIGNGSLLDLDWRSPHTVGETVVEDAALLSFEEIQKIFNKMMPITLDPAAITEHYASVDIRIDTIVLELQRVTEQNSIENGLLVPVWNFYGTRTNTEKSGEIYIDHNGSYDPLRFLTINAIDGSVIDVWKGY